MTGSLGWQDMTEFFLFLGVVVLSIALRTVKWAPLRKIGAFGFLAASFLAGYFLTGRIWVGVVTVAIWFLFPWIELLTRTRKMRSPVNRALSRQAPPGFQRFPELNAMTDEIEGEGFEYVTDSGWSWNHTRQFFRFFYHAEKRAQVAICFTEQENFSWTCVTMTSRHSNGKIFRSTNIPFSNPMKSPPGLLMRRDLASASFAEFLSAHEMWLGTQNCEISDLITQSPEDISTQIESESGNQISHNAESGIIAVCEKAETWRYSWRGLFYLYFQVIKDFVRWC
jgi:hypothetical protein